MRCDVGRTCGFEGASTRESRVRAEGERRGSQRGIDKVHDDEDERERVREIDRMRGKGKGRGAKEVDERAAMDASVRGSVSSSIILEGSKGRSQRRNPRVTGARERRRREGNGGRGVGGQG